MSKQLVIKPRTTLPLVILALFGSLILLYGGSFIAVFMGAISVVFICVFVSKLSHILFQITVDEKKVSGLWRMAPSRNNWFPLKIRDVLKEDIDSARCHFFDRFGQNCVVLVSRQNWYLFVSGPVYSKDDIASLLEQLGLEEHELRG